ncbi:MAG TPA: hypothetical protein VHZ52_11510 [Acidobacteriaceae bacterium]|nr:hypothetical protein [Acidobacteriaceae bacterium]
MTVCVQSVLAANSEPTDQQIIQGIDAAVLARARSISRYTVQEHYFLYRNGEANPAAEETIQTVYLRATGKEYTHLSQSGSALWRAEVIDKILAGEKDLNLANHREGAWITSKNYELHPEPGRVQQNGVQCIVVDLKPLRKSPHLFNGKIWVDASDYTVVRLEGIPSQSPNVLAGQATVSREYIKIDGFSMATHAQAHSHTFLFGDTLLKIDYSGYKIETDHSASQ